MRQPKPATKPRGFDSTLTPMIDVIFQLQIFFICTAGFALPEAILPAELPDTGAAAAKTLPEPTDLEIIRIRLTGVDDGVKVWLNDKPLSGVGELNKRLKRVGVVAPESPVILDVAPEVHLETVVQVYDQCLAVGLRKINFTASRTSAAPKP